MKKINYPLLIGSIILVFFIVLSFYPSLFTTKDPLYEEVPKDIEYKVDGEWVKEYAFNPIRPNKDNIMGTDDAGRDVYARLVYGARNTLKLALFIAVFRMLIALPFGIIAGMGSKFFSGLIRGFNTIFTAVPMLIFSFIILNIGYFRDMPMGKSIVAFTVVLTIVGWAKLAAMIEDSTKLVMEEDFIEGEIAIGKTKTQIAFQNILPHIIPTSISLFFKEMGMALFLIAQLAVLYVFVGATREVKELAFKVNYEMSLEPEWGASLSRIAYDIKSYGSSYWVVLFPVLIFSIAIMGINLVGEGLRIEFQKRNSKVISVIKKIFNSISPKMYIYQIKNIKRYRRPVFIKTAVIVIIIGYIVIPWHPSTYKFDINEAKSTVKELTDIKYEGRVSGSEGGFLAGNYISDKLKSYGFDVNETEVPLMLEREHDGEKVYIPEVLAPTIIKSGTVKLKNEKGEEKEYELHKDFTVVTINDRQVFNNDNDEIKYKGIAVDEEHVTKVDENSNMFLIERQCRGFDTLSYDEFPKIKGKSYDLRFVLFNDYEKNSNAYAFNCTTIFPFAELAKELENGYKEVEITLDYPELPTHQGRIITAFIPGKDKTVENPGEVIVIGANYDGVFTNDDKGQYGSSTTPVATLLEIARNLANIEEPLEKSIELIFWDNSSEGWTHANNDGSYYYSKVLAKTVGMAVKDGYYYFDIGSAGFKGDKKLEILTLTGQATNKRNYPMILEMDKRLKDLDIKSERYNESYSLSKALMEMQLNARSTISVGINQSWSYNDKHDKLENVNFKNMKNIGQIIIDTLTMNSHVMD